MSETAMWGRMRERLPLEMERITEKLNPGIADVVYSDPRTRIAGWVELKFLASLGRGDPPTPRIPWKSAAQPAFLNRWARRGNGYAGVLLYVAAPDLWVYWRAQKEPEWVARVQTGEAWDLPRTTCTGFDARWIVEQLTAP